MRPGAELTGAEEEFVDCLRSYPSTGLALIDCRVGDRRLGAIVITPRAVTVLEVRGFARRQSGLLSVKTDGQWTISGSPLDLDNASGGPTDRLEHGVHAVRVALEQSLQDSGHVCGAVVLVPYRGVVVRPARTSLRPGLDVLVGNTIDSHELRIYLESFSAAAPTITADRVRTTCSALGLEALTPPKDELLLDGFVGKRPPAPPPIARLSQQVRPTPLPPEPPKHRGKFAGIAVFGLALLGLFVVFVIVGEAVLSDPPSRSSTTTTVRPTVSSQVVKPTQCWPLQPDC
ncbi:NERD domain-containing protein [Nocardia camponoti]|nr:NERD domain-containing protein [Nocardia camponoti]